MSVTVGNNAYRISVDRLFSRLYDTDDYNHIENKKNNLNIRNCLGQLLDAIRNGNGVPETLANLGDAIRRLNQYEIDQTPARKNALRRAGLDGLFETIKDDNREASIRLKNKLIAWADAVIRYEGSNFLFQNAILREIKKNGNKAIEAYGLYVQEQQPVEH
jgi:hypothetical protein